MPVREKLTLFQSLSILGLAFISLSAAEASNDGLHPDPRMHGVGIDHPTWSMAKYEEEVRLHPKSAVAYLERGNARMNDADIELAMTDFDKAIACDPRCTRAYIGRYFVYCDLRKFDQALAQSKKAIELGPPDLAIDALNLQANLHKELKQFPLALAEYDRVIKSNLLSKRRLSWAYLQRGVVHDRLGQNAQAIEDYSTAIKQDPELGKAYVYRANDYRDLGDIKRALADYAFVVERVEHPPAGVRGGGFDSERKDVYHFRSILYTRIGRPDLARADKAAELRQNRMDVDLSPFQSR